MLSSLWARITGKDKRAQFPQQQAVSLERTGDYTIVFPYGLYADLPDEALARSLGQSALLPVTVKRPSDTARAEPTFFHPETNTRIVARNNGDLDIFTDAGGGNVNVFTVNVNVEASGNVNVTAGGSLTATVAGTTTLDTPDTVITGNLTVQGDTTLEQVVTSDGIDIGSLHSHPQGDDSAGNTQQNTGAPIP